MKTDIRVRYTQKVIREAFWQLLRQKSVNRITVKEVCDIAQINRGTFYKHYLDCYDLLEKIEEDILKAFENLLESEEEKGFQEIQLTVLNALKDGGEYFRALIKHGSGTPFFHRLIGRGFRYMEKRLGDIPMQDWAEKNRGYGYTFLISGYCAVIEYWLLGGMEETPEEVAKILQKLSTAMVQGMQK